MKLALSLASLATGKKFSASPGNLAKQGASLALQQSPELGRLVDLRGPLIAAGKTAATAALSRQVESIAENLGKRADAL
ncbi:MAG: hypothetical protein GEV09_25585, partial [Pseudonocardiaceae bacterium]|nr:hypothetical protein [Pseudonocardiaceae bacterium]